METSEENTPQKTNRQPSEEGPTAKRIAAMKVVDQALTQESTCQKCLGTQGDDAPLACGRSLLSCLIFHVPSPATTLQRVKLPQPYRYNHRSCGRVHFLPALRYFKSRPSVAPTPPTAPRPGLAIAVVQTLSTCSIFGLGCLPRQAGVSMLFLGTIQLQQQQ